MSSHFNTEKTEIYLLLSGRILWRGYSSPIGKWWETRRLTPSFSPGGCWARWKNSVLYCNLNDCQSWRWYKFSAHGFPRLWQPPARVLRAANLSCIWKSCLWCALAVGLLGCSCFWQPCARDFPSPELFFGQWEVDLVWISWGLCFYFFLWSIMPFTVSRSA